MAINWKAILGEDPYRLLTKKLPDGTWMAWLDQAPTSFAIAETQKQAAVDLLNICFGTVQSEEKKKMNTMKIEIVFASIEDAPAIAKLNLLFNEVDESPDAIARRMSDPACVETVILAKSGGEAVGVALVRIVPNVLYPQPHAELTELYVMETFRQRGIAGRLIAQAENLAREKGARSILVQTGDDNLPALSLYKKYGYEKYDLALKKRLF